jgi:phenylacetic acid degradation operon negative regulatory protein
MGKDERMTVSARAVEDEALPAGSRRREVGSASARSLLLTVLGEFVHPRGTPVWTATLVAGLAELGVEEKSARQAIARSAADGVLESEKSGRRVSWHITQPGTRLLAEGTRRIYSFMNETPPWDGSWLVLSVAIPETQRQLRHKLRTRLTWLGMGSPSPGIWILPDVNKVADVAAVIDELDLNQRAFAWTGKLASIGEPDVLIEDAWSLDDVEQRYEDFLATFGKIRAGTPPQAFQAQVRLVQAWRRFPFLDPALPRELLDHDWPGPRAAKLFHRRHDEWHGAAQRYWTELQSQTSS